MKPRVRGNSRTVDAMAIITLVVLVWIGAAALALALGRVAGEADAAEELRRRGMV